MCVNCQLRRDLLLSLTTKQRAYIAITEVLYLLNKIHTIAH